MSFASEASKLLTNKYFLYFMVFLAATNVLGYLVTNKLNAVIFFALVSLLSYQFSKNMAIILLISIVATNFLMANKGFRFREGLENSTAPSLEKKTEIDNDIATALTAVKNSATNDEAKSAIENSSNSPISNDVPNKPVDQNNLSLNKNVEDKSEPMGVGSSIKNKKGSKEEHFGPRLDYAATIEQSYANLDNILGSDSIQKLTGDTQTLMKQQQNLFNTMNQMLPVLEGAQNMLKNFKVDGLTDSLKNIGKIANAPLPKM
jgi:hypothetical protein